MDTATFLLAGTMLAGTPLLIAALGELVVEKSGVLNLSVEGMMALGAIAGFVAVKELGSHWLAVASGAAAGAGLAAVFAFLTLGALGNQVASGLAVGVLGLGLSGLLGRPYNDQTVAPMADWVIPGLSALPVLGPGLFQHPPLVYAAPLMAVATWWTLKATKLGLTLRAVGEAPQAAHAVGLKVRRVRLLAVLYGGACAGVAGAFISTVSATLWADGMIAGRGWIVVALVVFGAWRAGGVAVGAYLFGAATLSGLLVQTTGVAIPSQLLVSAPYIVTIVALALMSTDARRIRLNAPASLGQTYLETK